MQRWRGEKMRKWRSELMRRSRRASWMETRVGAAAGLLCPAAPAPARTPPAARARSLRPGRREEASCSRRRRQPPPPLLGSPTRQAAHTRCAPHALLAGPLLDLLAGIRGGRGRIRMGNAYDFLAVIVIPSY